MGDSRILDCNAPGFIKRFFTTSRLHHLSTWKADIADFVMGQMSAKSRSSAASGHKASLQNEPFRTIMHIDMDCFFASVGIRDRQHLFGKPVAVAHSQGGVSLDYSTSEIASCNYEARAKGVKNGVFIGSAKELAPDLVIIPYEFEQYDAVSKILYRTLINAADFIQSVSCDEAFVDVTFCIQQRLMIATRTNSVRDLLILTERDASMFPLYEELAKQLANEIRAEIFEQTRCHASVGIAGNVLLSRIATSKAKPNGVHSLLSRENALLHLRDLPIRGLPGVGRSTSDKCTQLQLNTCGDVQAGGERNSAVLAQLRKELGEKTGESLHGFCWGHDDRVLENKPRQSVGSDINWGIRFTNSEQADAFLKEYCTEVYDRLDRSMHTAGHVTVNLKKKLYEGEPGKFLGCGHCLDLSRSMVPGRAIASAEALYRCVSVLYKEIGLQPLEVRGVGIHLKKLQQRQAGSGALFKSMSNSNQSHIKSDGANALQDFLFHGQHEGAPSTEKEEPQEAVRGEKVNSSIRNYFHNNNTGNRSVGETIDVRDESAFVAPPGPQNIDDNLCHLAPDGADEMVEAATDHVPVALGGDSGTQNSEEDIDQEQQQIEVTDLASARSESLEAQMSSPVRAVEASSYVQPVAALVPAPVHVPMSMDDVDLDVFLALPEDIQRELQHAFNPSSGVAAPSSDSVAQKGTARTSPPRKRAKTAMKSSKPTGKSVGSKTNSSQPSILSLWGRST